MPTISSRMMIKLLEEQGWRLARVSGDHHIFVHPEKPGRVVVPHPVRDLPIGTVKAIRRQARLS